MAVLQRQLVQALAAARPICKDSGRAVAWRHEHERQVKPSRFACMLLVSTEFWEAHSLPGNATGMQEPPTQRHGEVTCLRVLASYTSHLALAVCEQVRQGCTGDADRVACMAF